MTSYGLNFTLYLGMGFMKRVGKCHCKYMEFFDYTNTIFLEEDPLRSSGRR
jgi:hypothetical protein